MLLSSGNDAAQAAAIRLGGDFAGFAEKMNQKAQQLGLQNTLFVTPSGLDADGQGSCARDLAVLTCAALQNADFAAICSQQQGHIEVGGVEYWMTNHNRLLKEYDGCIGVKTGFTDSAGRCLVAAASRGGATVIAVVLCDGNDWVDASALLDWGFDQLTETTLTASLPAGLCQRETPTVFLAPGETLTEEIRLSAGGTGIVRWLDSDGAVRGWSLIRPQQ
jgi:D-alanyl-D-alanine carboxypeptidase/D-alanyl-D-alanine carboxypeptidase (penicillin-binding protein 5/6)